MFLACIMFVINKYLSNESILALPISLVLFNQSCRKLLSHMYSKIVELGIPCQGFPGLKIESLRLPKCCLGLSTNNFEGPTGLLKIGKEFTF